MTSIGREFLATVNGTTGCLYLSLSCFYKPTRQNQVQGTDKVKRYLHIKSNIPAYLAILKWDQRKNSEIQVHYYEAEESNEENH